jgi:hypothetical protein
MLPYLCILSKFHILDLSGELFASSLGVNLANSSGWNPLGLVRYGNHYTFAEGFSWLCSQCLYLSVPQKKNQIDMLVELESNKRLAKSRS